MMIHVIEKKKQLAKEAIIAECGCGAGCTKCSGRRVFVDSMSDSGIPESYWTLSYKGFSGSPLVKAATESYIKDLKEQFKNGSSICFAGSPGTGKTMSACTILKAAIRSGYTTYYTSLSDMVSYMSDFNYKTSFYSKMVDTDFLCVDEVDARHFADTESSENFFARSFERVFRFRVQNRLPIILATNHSTLTEAFTGQFRKIFESIGAQNIKTISSIGVDFRLKSKAGEK